MNKAEFLHELAVRLSSLPPEEVERTASYYSEIIDDRMEDGMSEEDAVAGLGDLSSITEQIIMDTSLSIIVKSKVRGRRPGAFTIVLLILGVPLWLPLLLCAFTVFLSVYIVLWAVDAVFWSVVIALCAGGLGGMLAGSVLLADTRIGEAASMFGSALVCAGFAILAFHGVLAVTKAFAGLTALIFRHLKLRIAGRKETLP
jgi:uncharacterized membrane protein